MLKRRRAAQINRQSVPYGSAKVEYLESSGTQWIDTGLVLKTNDFHFTIKYALLGGPDKSKSNRLLQGSNFTWVCSLAENGYGWITLPKKDGGIIVGKFNLIHTKGEPIILEFKAEEVIKNGTKLDINASMSQITNYDSLQDTNISLKLCSFGDPTQYTSERFVGFLNNVRLNIDNIKSNFIPTLDKTQTPCMFDLIRRKNFYNSGTGNFYYPKNNNIPNNYTRIDYLESTGTQRIQTDYCPCSETKIESICYFVQTGHNGRFFGNGSTYDGRGDTFTTFMSAYTTGAIIFDFGNIRKDKNNYNLSVGKHTIIVDKNGIMVDGTMALDTEHTTTFQSTRSISFFASGGIDSQTGDFWKIYDFIIYETDVLRHSFVPCLDPSGTPCMYDTVTQTPYYNAGTGDFLYPSPTSSTTYSMRRPQAEYAKMTNTGVRRLYHVPVDYEGYIEEYASENGFKLLNETESPIEVGKYYAFRWVETDTEIMTEWYETEPPTDEFGQVIENNNEQQSTTFNLRRPAPIDNTVYSNNAQWAKMTDTGVHKIYHTPIGYEGSLEEYAIENGYKRLIETESPNEEGKYYSFKWVETDDTLTTEWFEVDPPQEEFIEENLDNPTE